MVGDVCDVDSVVWGATECVSDLAGYFVKDLQVVSEGDGSAVEEDVVVGAEAQDVGWYIGAVVRSAYWANVSAFGVRAGGELQS